MLLVDQTKKISEARQCSVTADLGFVVDASGSVASQYPKLIRVIKSIVDDFGLSAKGTHAGTISFSDRAEVVIGFDQYYDTAAFKNALEGLPSPRGRTRIGTALLKAYNDLFTSKSASRPGVPKIMILITDGVQATSSAKTIKANDAIIEKLVAKGIKVIYKA